MAKHFTTCRKPADCIRVKALGRAVECRDPCLAARIGGLPPSPRTKRWSGRCRVGSELDCGLAPCPSGSALSKMLGQGLPVHGFPFGRSLSNRGGPHKSSPAVEQVVVGACFVTTLPTPPMCSLCQQTRSATPKRAQQLNPMQVVGGTLPAITRSGPGQQSSARADPLAALGGQSQNTSAHLVRISL